MGPYGPCSGHLNYFCKLDRWCFPYAANAARSDQAERSSAGSPTRSPTRSPPRSPTRSPTRSPGLDAELKPPPKYVPMQDREFSADRATKSAAQERIQERFDKAPAATSCAVGLPLRDRVLRCCAGRQYNRLCPVRHRQCL